MTTPAGRGNSRRYQRSAIELPVVIGDAANRVEAAIQFDTSDLSVGGAFLRSDLLFEVGEEVKIQFILPNGYRVEAAGQVVRVARDSEESTSGMGIAFVNLSGEDRVQIAALITRGDHG